MNLQNYSIALRCIKEAGDDLIKLGTSILIEIDGFTADEVKLLSTKSIEKRAIELGELFENTTPQLKEIIKINGKLYGFDPHPEDMEHGAYSDICALAGAVEDADNVARIMAIMYRPITTRGIIKKRVYSIDSYVKESKQSFEDRVKLFNKELTAVEFIGVLSFFLQGRKV
jgi:hypothetical protein